jgi:hypothetical protein
MNKMHFHLIVFLHSVSSIDNLLQLQLISWTKKQEGRDHNIQALFVCEMLPALTSELLQYHPSVESMAPL